jgi:hypothetical protein
MSRNQVFAGVATVAVLLGLTFGFHQAGSPGVQRLANADAARIEDLTTISGAVGRYFTAYGRLPRSIAELSAGGSVLRLSDPDTKTTYEYRPLDERRFELCAVFSTDSTTEPRPSPRGRVHGAGRQCFAYPE